jgi:hypothetical protein
MNNSAVISHFQNILVFTNVKKSNEQKFLAVDNRKVRGSGSYLVVPETSKSFYIG